jgi:exonuclease VII small subunit
VSDSSEALKKSPAEILIAIDQMRKAGVLTPIKIEQFKPSEVSQQEAQLIRQQVQQLNVAPEQLEPMVSALAKMEPIEREAALASMRQGTQIKTDLAAPLADVKKVGSPDEAAVELKNLEKNAKAFLKKKDVEKALAAYRSAELLAFQWNLKEQTTHFREIQLDLETRQLNLEYANAMKEGKKAEAKDPASSLEHYKKALEMAQKLFKRGIASAEKDVVTLAAAVNRLEAAAGGQPAPAELKVSKKDLLNERKDLLGQMKGLEKEKMWAKLEKICLRLEQISNELYKMGDMVEARNVKLYRKQASRYSELAASMQEDASGSKDKTSE